MNGMDCAGLIIKPMVELGLPYPTIANYRREPRQEDFMRSFYEYMVPKLVKDVLPGDALTFRDATQTMHCAIYDIVNGKEYIIHSFATRRMVVEQRYDTEWRGKTTFCFAYPGVDD